jgi:hypothetical protein
MLIRFPSLVQNTCIIAVWTEVEQINIDGGKLGQEFCDTGVQDLGRYCCIVLIWTSPRPAIMMAHI